MRKNGIYELARKGERVPAKQVATVSFECDPGFRYYVDWDNTVYREEWDVAPASSQPPAPAPAVLPPAIFQNAAARAFAKSQVEALLTEVRVLLDRLTTGAPADLSDLSRPMAAIEVLNRWLPQTGITPVVDAERVREAFLSLLHRELPGWQLPPPYKRDRPVVMKETLDTFVEVVAAMRSNRP